MTSPASSHDRRAALATPYRRDHEASVQARMERAPMPKDLPGLLRWFADEWSPEIPDQLHTSAIWRDRVNAREAAEGIKPLGGSLIGSLAYDDDFRRRLENGPSEVDHQDETDDGRVYFRRPLAAALARIARSGTPLMARHLLSLATAAFDWRTRADAIGWAHEEYEVYIREALIRLWLEFREWVRAT